MTYLLGLLQPHRGRVGSVGGWHCPQHVKIGRGALGVFPLSPSWGPVREGVCHRSVLALDTRPGSLEGDQMRTPGGQEAVGGGDKGQ